MVEIIVIIITILLVGFFAGAETALISCNKIRVHYKKEKGNLNAKIIWDMLQNPHRVLGTTLAGTNLFVVAGSILATHLCIRWFGEKGALIATLVMTPLILIFGEILPKTIARVAADKMVIYSAPLLVFFQKLLFPVVIFIEVITSFIIRMFGLKQTKKDPILTREDIELLVRQITREGVLERSEQGAIHQIFDFRYTRVGDIMVTLREMISIDYADDRQKIIEKAQKYKFTRYPVFENKQIKGVLNIFDIFYNEGNWHKFVRPLEQVYANQRVNQVLYNMQRNNDLISAVVRKGRCIGIITLEDIINEIELI